MSQGSSAKGATVEYPAMDTGTAFDEDVKERIGTMAQNGNIPEGTPWFNRRLQKFTLDLLKSGQTGSALLVLDIVEEDNPGLALDTRHKALLELDTLHSVPDEKLNAEKARYHILGSTAFQLIDNQRLPENERIFSSDDTERFFSDEFSFETRRQLADLLALHKALGPEIGKYINEKFGFFTEDVDVAETFPETIDTDEAAVELKDCYICGAQGKVWEDINNEGLTPFPCKNCHGTGKVPKKL